VGKSAEPGGATNLQRRWTPDRGGHTLRPDGPLSRRPETAAPQALSC
jgi:hypothetical protein